MRAGVRSAYERGVNLYFARSKPEGSASHLVYLDLPYFYIAHGRFAILELVVDVLLHDDVEYTSLFIHILYETDVSVHITLRDFML